MARGFLAGSLVGVLTAGVSAVAVAVAFGPPDHAADASDPPPVTAAAAPKPAVVERDAADRTDTARAAAPKAAGADPQAPAAALRSAKPTDGADVIQPPAASAVIADGAQPGRRPAPEVQVVAPATPKVVLNAPAGPAAIGADTNPPAVPLVGALPQGPERAVAATQGSVARSLARTDPPVLALPKGAAPGAPLPDPTPVITTLPAQPPSLPVPQTQTALVSDDPSAPKDAAATAPRPSVVLRDAGDAKDATDVPAAVDIAKTDARDVDDVAFEQALAPPVATGDLADAQPKPLDTPRAATDAPKAKTDLAARAPRKPDITTAPPNTDKPADLAQDTKDRAAPIVPATRDVAQSPERADPSAQGVQTADATDPPRAAGPGAPPVSDAPQTAALDRADPNVRASDPVQGVDSDGPAVPPPGRPSIGKPAGSLLNRDTGVTTSRLPSVGAAATSDKADGLAPDSALIQFAAKVAVADEVPRLSIVLIDDGSGPMGPEALKAFPFPVSFAITTAHPAAAEAAAAYRALGFEVVVLADIPAGAQASDVEVTLTAALDAVPEAVAVLEGPSGGLRESRAAATQAATVLAATGHGLVLTPKGLNTAETLVRKAGVPAATLFRDFDGEGQNTSVIRRSLDQAAFRARQKGAVIMLGRLRADTVSALLLWGLQDRGSSIALVPVSKILQETMQ